MKITGCTIQDGKLCANLIMLLGAGKWELTGKDWDTFKDIKQWLHGVALSMAEDLRGKETAPAEKAPDAGGMRIKSMGSLSTPGKKISKRKK